MSVFGVVLAISMIINILFVKSLVITFKKIGQVSGPKCTAQ